MSDAEDRTQMLADAAGAIFEAMRAHTATLNNMDATNVIFCALGLAFDRGTSLETDASVTSIAAFAHERLDYWWRHHRQVRQQAEAAASRH